MGVVAALCAVTVAAIAAGPAAAGGPVDAAGAVVAAGPAAGSGPTAALGPWRPDGPTRTIMEAVTPLGSMVTSLLAQGPLGVRRSSDGGRTWAAPAGLPARAADAGPGSSVLAVLATERDRAWLAVTGAPSIALAGDAEANEVAGPILHVSADAGATWAPVPGDGLAGRIVFDMVAVPVRGGEPVLLAADATAGILRSEDGGRTFTSGVRGIAVDPDIGGIVVGGLAAGTEPGVAFAATTGAIWRTGDAGLTWQAACIGSEALPCGRPFVAPGDPSLVIGAGFGGVVRSVDGGLTWARVGTSSLPGPEDGGIDVIAFSTDDPPVAWASGPRGVFRSTDGGEEWAAWDGGLGEPSVAASDRVAIDPGARARGWRIHGLAFFATDDGGRTWTELPGPDAAGIAAYAALVDAEGTHLVGAADGIVLRAERRWETTRADAIATDLAVAPPGAGPPGAPSPAPSDPAGPGRPDPDEEGAGPEIVYATTYGAGVLRSDDGGATWADWSRGLPRAPAWAILPGRAESGRVVAAGDAGIFERDVTAPAWARLGIGLPDAAARTLVRLADGSLLAGLETRGVWRLARGIDEWRPVGLDGRSILSLATASADGRVLLAATDRRGLWRSADGGRTWRRTASTRASASVAWDPVTGLAILATGSSVLASADAGLTWRPAAAGLTAADRDRPWARSTTRVAAVPGGGFVLATLGGTWVARPEAAP